MTTHALILAAGLGTRLRPLTLVRAKPAIPVAGEPIVRRIARWLATSGVTEIVINLHHLPASLTAVVGDGSDLGVRARYSWEQPRVLGSAGGPRLALPVIGADPFFIVNGDTLTDVNLAGLAAAHAASGALVTMALVPNTEPLRYGGIRLDGQSRVTGFVPRGKEAEGSYHFVGAQIAGRQAFQSVTAGEAVNSTGQVYNRLIAERLGSVMGWISDSTFLDIGTVSDYVSTSRLLADRESKIAMDAGRPGSSGQDVHVHPSAVIRGSILWNNITIGRDCRIEDCIVTDGVSAPAGASYRDAILIGTAAGVSAMPIAESVV